MEQIVLDTNVILKLFLKEEWSETAIRIKDAHISGKVEVLLPSLTKYELINVLKYKNFNKEEIKEALEVIRDYWFGVVELNDPTINKIVDICIDYNISSYDATYVALAHARGAIFYTADEKLVKSVKMPLVKHMKEFKLD